MRRIPYRKLIAWTLLAGSLAMVAYGAGRKHTVYDPLDPFAAELVALPNARTISELQLVIDSTFGGVVRRAGELWSTYDRTVARGKRSCPT